MPSRVAVKKRLLQRTREKIATSAALDRETEAIYSPPS